MCAYGWLTLMHDKPTQHCEAIILQSKINKFKKGKPRVNRGMSEAEGGVSLPLELH